MPPQLSSQKVQAVSASYAQSKLKWAIPREFPDYFEYCTYHTTALGWLKNWTKKESANSDFRPFQACHFKIVTVHIAITTADWARLYKLLYVLLDVRICFLATISLCKQNTNTLIGTAILFSGHPYIWAHYSEPKVSMKTIGVSDVLVTIMCTTGAVGRYFTNCA